MDASGESGQYEALIRSNNDPTMAVKGARWTLGNSARAREVSCQYNEMFVAEGMKLVHDSADEELLRANRKGQAEKELLRKRKESVLDSMQGRESRHASQHSKK